MGSPESLKLKFYHLGQVAGLRFSKTFIYMHKGVISSIGRPWELPPEGLTKNEELATLIKFINFLKN